MLHSAYGAGSCTKSFTVQALFYGFGRSLIRAYARTMLRVNTSLESYIPAGPKIVVANHPCTSDPLYLTLLFPEPISILLIENPFKIPVVGAFLRLSKQISVSPGNGRLAFDRAHEFLKVGYSVAIFPEGDSNLFGSTQTPRTGAARLALLTKLPVVPIGIYLQHERARLISSSIRGHRVVGHWYLNGPLGMTVGAPLYFDGTADDRVCVKAVSEEIMKKILLLAQDSKQRIEGNTSSI